MYKITLIAYTCRLRRLVSPLFPKISQNFTVLVLFYNILTIRVPIDVSAFYASSYRLTILKSHHVRR